MIPAFLCHKICFCAVSVDIGQKKLKKAIKNKRCFYWFYRKESLLIMNQEFI